MHKMQQVKVQYVLAFHLSDYFHSQLFKNCQFVSTSGKASFTTELLKGENMYSIYRCAVLAVLQKCIICGKYQSQFYD